MDRHQREHWSILGDELLVGTFRQEECLRPSGEEKPMTALITLAIVVGCPAIILWMALSGPTVGGEHNFYE